MFELTQLTQPLLHGLYLGTVVQPPVPQTLQFTGLGTSLSALVILAIAIDALIVAIWYIAGAVLNNGSIKAAAKGELGQFIGTALIAAILLATLVGFGYIFVQSNANANPQAPVPGTVLAPAYVLNTCLHMGYTNNYASASGQPFSPLIGNTVTQEFIFNAQSSSPSTSAPSACDIVYLTYVSLMSPQSGWQGDGTVYVEYPLAASAVIAANLTNQTATALNQTFVLDAYLNFLKSLSTTVGFCWQGPDTGSCASLPILGAPPIPSVAYLFYLKWSQAPLAGLDMVRQSLTTLSNLLYMALGSFLAQLTFIDIFIYVWPFLIFFGLALRGIFFLRKIGGLLIAVAIGAVLFYPTALGIEYLGANNPTVTQAQIAAQQGLPQSNPGVLAFCSAGSPYQYSVNFFVLPSIQGISQDCHCWPSWGILGSEVGDIAVLNEPFFWGTYVVDTLGNYAAGFLGKSTNFGCDKPGCTSDFTSPQNFGAQLASWGVPSCPIGTYAPASPGSGGSTISTDTIGGEGVALSVMQAYGIIGVAAYFLPIINILITIAAIRGLSGLMGGDVDIAGLTRFV